jgi:hypothetical protein
VAFADYEENALGPTNLDAWDADGQLFLPKELVWKMWGGARDAKNEAKAPAGWERKSSSPSSSNFRTYQKPGGVAGCRSYVRRRFDGHCIVLLYNQGDASMNPLRDALSAVVDSW